MKKIGYILVNPDDYFVMDYKFSKFGTRFTWTSKVEQAKVFDTNGHASKVKCSLSPYSLWVVELYHNATHYLLTQNKGIRPKVLK